METQLHGIAVQFQVHVDKMKVKAVHNIVFKNLPFHKYTNNIFAKKYSQETVIVMKNVQAISYVAATIVNPSFQMQQIVVTNQILQIQPQQEPLPLLTQPS